MVVKLVLGSVFIPAGNPDEVPINVGGMVAAVGPASEPLIHEAGFDGLFIDIHEINVKVMFYSAVLLLSEAISSFFYQNGGTVQDHGLDFTSVTVAPSPARVYCGLSVFVVV